MNHNVKVADSTVSFECAEGETILDAAEAAGLQIPYSCRKGVCASCEGRLVSGTAMVRGQGRCNGPTANVRLCQARPESDVTIAPSYCRPVETQKRKTLSATVFRLERPAPDVVIVRLRFPIGVRAPFRAGQYLRILMPDGDSRNYSLANPPQRNDGAELHIRVMPGGAFSDRILQHLVPGDTLEVELPFGMFGFDVTSHRQAILLATGTGFAPICAILGDQIARDSARPVHLFWGARRAVDLYALDRLLALDRQHDWLQVTPVLSEPDSDWAGATGLVHHEVMKAYPDMRQLEVHACGAPAMIDAARHDFVTSCGLDRSAFLSDAFVDTSSEAAVSGSARAGRA